MEKLVAMSKNSSQSENRRLANGNGNPSSSRSFATSHGEPSADSSCSAHRDEQPYAQVVVSAPVLRAKSPASPTADGRESAAKTNFFRRLTAPFRRHSSHPELAGYLPSESVDIGRSLDKHSGWLRESRSLDDVLGSDYKFYGGCDAVVFVNNSVEPECRVVSCRKSPSPPHQQAAEVDNDADAHDEDVPSGDDLMPPAIPPRLYRDGEASDGDGDYDDERGPHAAASEAVTVPWQSSSPSPAGAGEGVVHKSKLLADMLSLNKCGYYWGPIDEDAATKELSDQPEGTFLVHDSRDTHHLYAVSVVLDETVEHFLVDSFDDQSGYTFSNPALQGAHPTPDDIVWSTLQSTVPDLVEWAQHLTASSRHRRGLRPYLMTPLNHPYEVPRLQELCRTFLCKEMKITRHQIRLLPLPRIVQDFLLQYGYFAA